MVGKAAQALNLAKATAQAVGAVMAPYLGAIPKPPPLSSPPPANPKPGTVSSDSWYQSVNALAAEFTASTEYKTLPSGVKGGAICMDMLLHQKCHNGDACPRHHVSGHVCLAYQTKEGV